MAASAAAAAPPTAASSMKAKWQRMTDTQLQRVWQLFWRKQLGKGDVERWFKQGFTWSEYPGSTFGLLQSFGGPCGVLAAVQAFTLKHLIFGEKTKDTASKDGAGAAKRSRLDTSKILQPDAKTRENALVSAMSDILYQSVPEDASDPRVSIVACQNGGCSLSTKANCFLQLSVKLTKNNREADIKAVRLLVAQNLKQYHGPSGAVLFVMAVLLSRGLDVVRADMDEPVALTAQFGHCTQELINLLLLGAAHSQVFDGSRNVCAGIQLKGVLRRPDIGFLSYHEAMRLCTVGRFFKYPRYPIFVVSSGNHLTTLFGTEPSIVEQTPEEKLSDTVTRSFSKLDPDDQGFVALEKLSSLVSDLGDAVPQTDEVRDYIRDNVDKGSLGLVLRLRFQEVVKEALNKFGGEADVLRRQLRSSFEKLDNHKNGFVATADLPAVIANMKATISPANLRDVPIFGDNTEAALAAFRGKVDPDHLGIILWPQFEAQAKIDLLKAPPARPPTAAKVNTLPKIDLIYYNGLKRTIKGEDAGPQVSRFQLVQAGGDANIGGSLPPSASQLERVLRTRFPNVIIDWNGRPPPSING